MSHSSVSEHEVLSLVSTDDFHYRLAGRNLREQLEFCQEIFLVNQLVRQKCHKAVYLAWKWIEDHELYSLNRSSLVDYRREIDSRYSINEIVEEERRKASARLAIQNHWLLEIETCLGPLCPPVLGRDLLEKLAKLAKHCPNVTDAIKSLRSAKAERPLRSRKCEKFIICRDVISAIQAYQARQHPAKVHPTKDKRRSGRSRDPQQAQRLPNDKRQKLQRHYQQPAISKTMISPPSSPDEDLSEMDAQSSPAVTIRETADADQREHGQNYAEILHTRFPLDLPHLTLQLQQEWQLLRETVPPATWGKNLLRAVPKIFGDARPMNIYVPGVPPGIQHGSYLTASRDEAHILALTPDAASKALSGGPPDGTRVFVRHHDQSYGLSAHELLLEIERYMVDEIAVQDPTLRETKGSCRKMSPTNIVKSLRGLLENKVTVGYGQYQIPPYNLVDLPEMWEDEPSCLLRAENTKILQRLRRMNYSTGSSAPEAECGTTLGTHLAMFFPHVDHDGKGTGFRSMFGYTIIITWPKLSNDHRAEFNCAGNDFRGEGARYLVLSPGDEYIQTPSGSQDIHALIKVGYCGVKACVGLCTRSGYPKCCGMASAAYRFYWHEHFLADSIRSATVERSWTGISSQPPSPDVLMLIKYADGAIHRGDAGLGGSETSQQRVIDAIRVSTALV